MVIPVIAKAACGKSYTTHLGTLTNMNNPVVSNLYIKPGKRQDVEL